MKEMMAMLKKATKQKNMLHKKIATRLLKVGKAIYQQVAFREHQEKKIVFILGCQRSGTTMILRNIFGRDLKIKVYGEASPLSTNIPPEYFRFKPLKTVKNILDKDKASMIVIKPLVESQNSFELLDYFNNSKVIWMYRDYRDVVLSNIIKWGTQNGIDDLRPIVRNDRNNWRSEKISDQIRRIVNQYFAEDMNPYDAAAIFWFVRNSLFFELNLHTHQRVMLCKYEALVTQPFEVTQCIYKFIDQDFPGNKIISKIHASSLGKGKDIGLSTEIDQLCAELLQRLDRCFNVYKL